MVEIKQGNIWGRLGSGIGQGIGEQLPKEIERGRLASGLDNLSNQKDLTPFQQFSKLSSIPGATPQIIQSGSELLRQQAYLDSLKNQYDQGGPQYNQKGYALSQEELNKPLRGEVASTLATPESTKQSYKNFIPPTAQEERNNAYQNFQQNPARYNYDFNNALDESKSITQRNQDIQKSYNEQEKTAVLKEEKVKNALDKELEKLSIGNVPPKAKQAFEEKILNSVLSKDEGGEGLTQEQAIKKYSKELNDAERNYLDLNTLSSWSPRDFNRRLNSLQKDIESRGEQQLLMDNLIGEYQLSPIYSAHRAYPIKKGEIPELQKLGTKTGQPTRTGVSFTKINDSIYGKIKEQMGNKHSPLSIAYELQQKGYDPRSWLDYLNNHRDDLKGWQNDQLSKNINIIDLKDMWLNAWE